MEHSILLSTENRKPTETEKHRKLKISLSASPVSQVKYNRVKYIKKQKNSKFLKILKIILNININMI
jgi:hypothetical protein